ncbi:unnamed protein product [Discosporangium mesarthrocarpum]
MEGTDISLAKALMGDDDKLSDILLREDSRAGAEWQNPTIAPGTIIPVPSASTSAPFPTQQPSPGGGATGPKAFLQYYYAMLTTQGKLPEKLAGQHPGRLTSIEAKFRAALELVNRELGESTEPFLTPETAKEVPQRFNAEVVKALVAEGLNIPGAERDLARYAAQAEQFQIEYQRRKATQVSEVALEGVEMAGLGEAVPGITPIAPLGVGLTSGLPGLHLLPRPLPPVVVL